MTLLFLVALCLLTACTASVPSAGFVAVVDGVLLRNGQPYTYVGTNFWYGPILGSEGVGGDRLRLAAELDSLHALGLDNLRVLVGAEGAVPKESLVWPTLQTRPGEYNDTLLAGLDWLLKEMAARDMTAVLYLNNAWEWSGGYGQYLEWAGEGSALDPSRDGYDAYCRYAARFSTIRRAQQLYMDHIRAIVTRKNRYTGCRYANDPTIMAWQLCNEPRPFGQDTATVAGFKAWIAEAAALIKQLDEHHLVSVGSEGSVGCNMSLTLFEEIHENPNIDYLTIHIWPMNWGWISRDEMRCDTLNNDSLLRRALLRTDDYIRDHLAVADRLGKPLVIEEFGYARDGLRFDLASSTHGRDGYYSHLLSWCKGTVCGMNFWAWSGQAQPRHIRWQRGDDYCGDPAQEEQGLYSVFLTDSSTISLLRRRLESEE